MTLADLAIVFDLDDTLYPERDYVRSGLAAAARAFAAASPEAGEAAFLALTVGMFEAGVRGRIFDAALADLAPGAPPALLQSLIDAYRAHQPTSLSLFGDARDALERWGERGPLGLVTDGFLAVQQAKVRALGIEPCFAALCFTDALGGREAWKPSPQGFLEIMARLGRPASRCVYVADNPHKDFHAPRALGWRTVRVRRPGGEHALADARAPEWAPGAEITTLDDLDAALED